MEYNISGWDSHNESNIEPNTHINTHIMNINSIISFGKYKGNTVGKLLMYRDGVNYLKWATKQNIFKLDEDAKNQLNSQSCYMCYRGCTEKEFLKVYSKNDTIDFGKYKGETIDFLLSRTEGESYLKYLCDNQYIYLDDECMEIIKSHIGFNRDTYSSSEYLGWDDEGLACGMLECDCY